MILIDTNALVVLIVGLLDTGLLNRHKGLQSTRLKILKVC